MSATTDHPLARNAVMTLQDVATKLAYNWAPKVYGVPEAVAEVTQHDTLTKVIVERALVEAGIDVWWNDLLCRNSLHACDSVRYVAEQGVDLEALYGPNFDPIIGILGAAVLMTSADIAALAHQLQGDAFHRLYDEALEQARAHDAEKLLQRVLSDVMFACQKDASLSPAAHLHFLHGVRVLELAAAWYVLEGATRPRIPNLQLLEPIKRGLWPNMPNLNGGQ